MKKVFAELKGEAKMKVAIFLQPFYQNGFVASPDMI